MVDELLSDRLYTIDMNISLCFEANSSCDRHVAVFENTHLPVLPCDWTAGFINPGNLINIKLLKYLQCQEIF